MMEPRRIWWARPRKLCALERPGGGGRSHRPDRREGEIAYLKAAGVRAVISLMSTKHNLDAYRAAGMEAIHLPVEEDYDGLMEAVACVRRETRKAGAVAIHANRYTDFVAAVAALHLCEQRNVYLEDALDSAIEAGLVVTKRVAALVEAEPEWAYDLPDLPGGAVPVP